MHDDGGGVENFLLNGGHDWDKETRTPGFAAQRLVSVVLESDTVHYRFLSLTCRKNRLTPPLALPSWSLLRRVPTLCPLLGLKFLPWRPPGKHVGHVYGDQSKGNSARSNFPRIRAFPGLKGEQSAYRRNERQGPRLAFTSSGTVHRVFPKVGNSRSTSTDNRLK